MYEDVREPLFLAIRDLPGTQWTQRSLLVPNAISLALRGGWRNGPSAGAGRISFSGHRERAWRDGLPAGSLPFPSRCRRAAFRSGLYTLRSHGRVRRRLVCGRGDLRLVGRSRIRPVLRAILDVRTRRGAVSLAHASRAPFVLHPVAGLLLRRVVRFHHGCQDTMPSP